MDLLSQLPLLVTGPRGFFQVFYEWRLVVIIWLYYNYIVHNQQNPSSGYPLKYLSKGPPFSVRLKQIVTIT
jgi:hypothetical protein